MYEAKEDQVMHKPVLLDEVIEFLEIDNIAHLNTQAHDRTSVKRKSFIDATVGAAGHAVEIVKRGHFVLGIDDDNEMLDVARANLEKACPTLEKNFRVFFKLVNGNFRNIEKIASQNELDCVDGIILDLGVSTIQLVSPIRGFSFQKENAKLDMRINKVYQSVSASDLLNSLPKKKLIDLFSLTVEYRFAQKLAENVVERRKIKKYETIGDFLETISEIKKPNLRKKSRLHPSTLAFLALRIAVNSELENLKEVLSKSFELLKKKGRLLVISFHSGEDLIVKKYFKKAEEEGFVKIITKKPIVATDDEKKLNPSARSAKLRVIEKI